jgi:hypothetical protein
MVRKKRGGREGKRGRTAHWGREDRSICALTAAAARSGRTIVENCILRMYDYIGFWIEFVLLR